MDVAEARAELASLVEADSTPKLSIEDLDRLLNAARVVDEDGYAPVEDGWTPTWNLNYAAYHGWKRKLAKCGGFVDISTDGHNQRLSQVRDHCKEMVEQFRRQQVYSAELDAPDYRRRRRLLPTP